MIDINNLDDIPTTFDVNTLLQIATDLFPKRVQVKHGQIAENENLVRAYNVYEKFDDIMFNKKENTIDPKRKDFLELLGIMSWAVLGAWHVAITSNPSENISYIEVKNLNFEEIKKKFIENLDNEEGEPYRKLIQKHNKYSFRT